MDNFQYPGAIVRIKLKNFMTYTEVEVKPGPYLNMILGPNGTGKSAIVCCIIVGLAGEVSLTGRGGSPADFVKKGTDCATTELELYNDSGPNYIVQRKISITGRSSHKIDHKSDWRINSDSATKAEVVSLMKKLNIKVDNLCQFLPQDSVTQFVKMNSAELLVDTLKAAGDSQLVVDHQTLVSQTKSIKEKELTLRNLQQSCQENEVNAQRLESEVRLLRQRGELVKQKNICAQKIYYAKYLNAKKTLKEAKEAHQKISDELNQVESRCQPYREAVEHYLSEERKNTKIAEKSAVQVKSSTGLIEGYQQQLDQKKLTCANEFAKFKAKEEQEKQRVSELRLKKQELESLEMRLNEARDVDCSSQIETLETQLNDLKQKLGSFRNQERTLEDKVYATIRQLEDTKREHATINSIKDRKLQSLKNKYPHAHRITDWLSTNKHRFKGRLYLPLMCEINVKDPSFSRIVEHAISRQDFSAFLCENEEDLKTLTHVARDELKVKINVIHAPSDRRVSEIHSQSSRPDLSRYGVKAYLKDLIDAPEPIINYLCGASNFHRIPVAVGSTEAQVKELMNHCPKFYVDNSFYSISRSRYDNQQMIVKDNVRDGTHLQYSLDVEKLEQCEAKILKLDEFHRNLKEQQTKLFTEIEEVKEQWHSIGKRVSELKNKQSEKARIEKLIERAQDAIQRLNSEKIDISEERRKLKNAIDKLNSQIFNILEKMDEICQDFVQIGQRYMKSLISTKLATSNRRLATKKCKAAEADTIRLKEILKKQEAGLKTFSSALDSCRKEAEEKIDSFKNGRLSDQKKSEFDSIEQDDITELRNRRDDLDCQIQKIHCDSGHIVDEFRRQNREFKDKKARIADLESKIKDLKDAQHETKVSWISKVSDVIKVIDTNYCDFMQKLNYGGQVKLDYRQDDENDFAAYGIAIMVRYRDEENLIPLSSTRQSGGERSVATMVYMLALQTKTTVPFRCVDEINQGMDKDNERKVFELLVQTADSSSSQYFLVSPKLLPDLPYSEKMKIHIVFNGKKLFHQWNQSI